MRGRSTLRPRVSKAALETIFLFFTNRELPAPAAQLSPFTFPTKRFRLKESMSLFSKLPASPADSDVPAANQPLAERMRPRTLDEFIGQEKLLGPGKPLRTQIESDNIGSMLFWGPPGCGKTTLARLIARVTHAEFVSFSAVLAGIKEIKEVMAAAEYKSPSGHRTIVFVDEVHRFNKAQQDAFLPHVEAGHITFIGATTENPSFEVISPLLSRTKVYILEPLTTPQIVELLRRALADKRAACWPCQAAATNLPKCLTTFFFASPPSQTATLAPPTTHWSSPPRALRPRKAPLGSSPANSSKTFSSANSSATTKPGKSISISSPRSTNPCATPILTPPSIGSRA